MKIRLLTLLVFLLTISNLFSQTSNNVIKIDYDFYLNIGQSQYYSSSLYVGNGELLFKWGNLEEKVNVEEGEDPSKFALRVYKSDSIGTYNYTNYIKDSICSRFIWLNNKIFHLEENIAKIDWEILDETKKIGDFTCQKAKGKFRGRNYYAWFTTELPFRASPWKLHGLPGVVLKAHDEDNKIQFVFKSISKIEKENVFSLKEEGFEKISIEQYSKLQSSLANDLTKKIMSKMPRGAKIEAKSTEAIEIFN
jgi:GLPGLI family protein